LGKRTISQVIAKTATAIWATLQPSFILVPKKAKWKEVKNNMLTSGTSQTTLSQWIENTPA
jgi:hypothetical protein